MHNGTAQPSTTRQWGAVSFSSRKSGSSCRVSDWRRLWVSLLPVYGLLRILSACLTTLLNELPRDNRLRLWLPWWKLRKKHHRSGRASEKAMEDLAQPEWRGAPATTCIVTGLFAFTSGAAFYVGRTNAELTKVANTSDEAMQLYQWIRMRLMSVSRSISLSLSSTCPNRLVVPSK